MKELIIHPNKKLAEIQQEFSQCYPFLRLAFYTFPHRIGRLSSEEDLLDKNLTIQQLQLPTCQGRISLDGQQKVAQFEQAFSQKFGLHTQVLRKSYGKWLQTWITDVWTLEEQNYRGQLTGNKEV
ncbi:MAG: hypothetical protein AAFP19_16485 [Bacteroidota bacterium]